MADPDWSDGGVTFGGNGWRSDMQRRYPSPSGEGRPVSVSFVCWEGTAPGAVHTHVRFEPGGNPVWTGEAWAELWDDPERGDSDSISDSFVRRDRALRFAVRTVEKKFPAPAWAVRGWPEDFDPRSVLPDAAEDAAVVPCDVCARAVGEHDGDALKSCNDVLAGGAGTVGDPAIEVRCLVDAGPVSGHVGDEIQVLHDMHPNNVVLLFGCRALVVENGGATVHLAQVARERGVTVMLVPDAVSRYQRGTWLDIDPSAGTVEVS